MMAVAETVQKRKPHISEAKKKSVKEIEGLLKQAKIIGIVNMESLPAAQLSEIKKTLRGKADIYMTKKRLMKIAIAKLKNDVPQIDKITPLLKGMPALLFTKENPFTLYKILKKSKSPAPANEGQESPRDIVIPAGPTPFAPGPVISELAALRIKAGIEGGKVVVKADSTVIKQGEKFSAGLASMLTRLNIMPMEIGINLQAVFEEGVIYDKSVLDIDEEKFYSNLITAAQWALNLSIEAAYVTKDNRELFIGNAFRSARAVALESMFLADGIKQDVIEKAARQANALASEAKFEALWERTSQPAPAEKQKSEEKAESPIPAPEGKDTTVQHPNDAQAHKDAAEKLKELQKKGTLRNKE